MLGTARDLLVFSRRTGLAAVIGKDRSQSGGADQEACPEQGLVAQSGITVFWGLVFWQSLTDTPDLNGNREGQNSEKESGARREKLAAGKN